MSTTTQNAHNWSNFDVVVALRGPWEGSYSTGKWSKCEGRRRAWRVVVTSRRFENPFWKLGERRDWWGSVRVCLVLYVLESSVWRCHVDFQVDASATCAVLRPSRLFYMLQFILFNYWCTRTATYLLAYVCGKVVLLPCNPTLCMSIETSSLSKRTIYDAIKAYGCA